MFGKLITCSLIGFFALPCVGSLLLEKQFVGPGHEFAESQKITTSDHNGECVGPAKVTKRVPGATKFMADQGAEQTLCLQRQTVIKTHGAAFRKRLTQHYPLF